MECAVDEYTGEGSPPVTTGGNPVLTASEVHVTTEEVEEDLL